MRTSNDSGSAKLKSPRGRRSALEGWLTHFPELHKLCLKSIRTDEPKGARAKASGAEDQGAWVDRSKQGHP